VKTGVDLVTFSGDKLLGGPQAGILLGRRETLAKIRKHPLMRALRCDKMTLAALEATLSLYRDGRAAELPVNAMLTESDEALRKRADALLAAARAAAPGLQFEIRRVRSAVGGGALPLHEPASYAVAVMPEPDRPLTVTTLDAALRRAEPPVIGRISEGVLLLDVRTMNPGDVSVVAQALAFQDGA
jgi:L-seryl-tRNA(Ser) seleniumtransferase